MYLSLILASDSSKVAAAQQLLHNLRKRCDLVQIDASADLIAERNVDRRDAKLLIIRIHDLHRRIDEQRRFQGGKGVLKSDA